MLSNLTTMPSALAGSGSSWAPTAAFLATCDRPAYAPSAGVTGVTLATGGFHAGMALSNHNIKVWPLGPQDGSTG